MKHFLILAVILSGCGYRPAHDIVVSTEFTIEQQEMIFAAADEWCEVAGVCLPVSVGDDPNVVVEKDETRCPCWGMVEVSVAGDPLIRLCQDSPHFQKTAAHEIGHAISAQLDHPTSGVMSAPWDGSEHVSEADAEWLRESL